jgi:hypothetical protein
VTGGDLMALDFVGGVIAGCLAGVLVLAGAGKLFLTEPASHFLVTLVPGVVSLRLARVSVWVLAAAEIVLGGLLAASRGLDASAITWCRGQTLMRLLSDAVPAEQVAEFDSARQRATDADLIYEDHREIFHRVPTAIVHTAVNAAGTQLATIGALDNVADAWLLTPDVLIQALRGGLNSTVIRASTEQQRLTLQRWKSAPPPLFFGEPAQPLPTELPKTPLSRLSWLSPS